MKIIVAGLSKTGTKSLKTALIFLGYKVHDYLEHVVLYRDEYKKILYEGWTTEDFKRMYEDVDVVLDIPAAYFWEEIHKAFPEAKIILSVRENEEIWFESLKRQVEMADTDLIFKVIYLLSPTWRRATKDIRDAMASVVYGYQPQPWRYKRKLNKEMTILKYRTHNAFVKANAPKDKLLVFNCKQGWGPLCNFLGVDVPDQSFPFKNVRGNIVEEMLKTDPIAMKLMREVKISTFILLSLSAIGGYYFYTRGPHGIYTSVVSGLSWLSDCVF